MNRGYPSMTPQTLLTLPPDLVIQSIAELSKDVQQRLDGEDGDAIMTRAGIRSSSVVIDAPTTRLLELFQEPRTLTDAVLLYSLPRRLKAAKILHEAFPTVERFVRQGFLVDSQIPQNLEPSQATWQPGEVLPGLGLVISKLIHLQEDVELYQVWHRREGRRVFNALKLARRSRRPGAGSLKMEGEVLRELSGHDAPHLRESGELDGLPYLLMEWCSGVSAERAAREWRRTPPEEGRPALQHLIGAIARAYANLHRQGILHGDVHPGNLLVDGNTQITLLDFAAGRWIDDPKPATGRPGVAFYFEPEVARAALQGRGIVPPTPAGEQYAVAALLYALVTGHPTHDFRLERRSMYRQLAEDPPRTFAQRGITPWPALEAILTRALAKDPAARFPSCEDLATALTELEKGATPPNLNTGNNPQLRAELFQDSEEILEKLMQEETPEVPAPTASTNFGLAGAALLLLGIASRREDPRALEAADRLSCKALHAVENDAGFVAEDIGLHRKTIGHVSPYYSEPGPWAVQAMIARAQGGLGADHLALQGFLRSAAHPEGGPPGASNLDLILGHSGVLLLCALLADGSGSEGIPPDLVALAERQLDLLAAKIAGSPIQPHDNLGMAHGWAGYLYSTLQWARVSGREPTSEVLCRLEELAHLGEPEGRGLRWIWSTPSGISAGSMPGWCNGSAGHVFLWSLAWRLLDEPRYRHLAEAAGWSTWESPENAANLCCGLVGRCYALLNLYRHTGVQSWWRRACDLANRIPNGGSFSTSHPNSLFKGKLSLALLMEDLQRPEAAAMPFFEEEGWPLPPPLDLPGVIDQTRDSPGEDPKADRAPTR